MTCSWWILWMAFMFLFLVSPTIYGLGHREWGPPYPRCFHRRHVLLPSTTGQPAALRNQVGLGQTRSDMAQWLLGADHECVEKS